MKRWRLLRSEALHLVGDLNGDGLALTLEDVRIAKAAVGKVAVDVAGDAVELGRAVIRHQVVKDAAAGAVVGGVIGSVIPIVGTHVGAAVGAATAAVRGGSSSPSTGSGQMIGKSAREAADLAQRTLKPSAKRRTTKRAKPTP